MQRSGLEWLFRLTQEPQRLAKRYLVNNPLFVVRAAAQLLGIRKYKPVAVALWATRDARCVVNFVALPTGKRLQRTFDYGLPEASTAASAYLFG